MGAKSFRGSLCDVSSTGAKVYVEGEDYRGARGALADALRSGAPLELEVEGLKGPRQVFLVWYGVSTNGGFAVGLELSGNEADRLPQGSAPPPTVELVAVQHRAGRQAQLAIRLRELFSALSTAEFALETALGLLCEKVRALTGAEGVTFWALANGDATLRAQAGRWQLEPGARLGLGGDSLIPVFPVLKETMRRGQQLFANEADRSVFSAHPGVLQFDLRSIMIIPVFGREVDFGVLIFGHSRDPFAFGAQEQADAEIFANQAALFFEKAQLLQEFRQSASFLAAMNRIALAFHERLDVDRVLDVICQESRDLFQVDLATVFLRENGAFSQRAASGMAVNPGGIDSREVSTPESQMIDRGEAFFLNDFEKNPFTRHEVVRRYMGSRSVKSLMVLPIHARDEVLGTLTLADRNDPQRFSQQDLERGKLLAEQAAQALVNARLYERVAQSKRIIREQDRFRILGELAGVVAHEIKNALVPLRTLVELLPQRYNDADFREWYAKTVRQEVERMHELVNQLSRFRGVETHRPEPTEPSALVRSVVELVNPEARARRIQLIVESETLPPVPIVANELRQVLLNLILNAIQAVEEKGVVRAGARRSADGTGTLFWVADNGPGIAPERLERIFDALYTTKQNGSGLGLAIARDLVQGQGGTISVDSAPGQGATFTIFIPGQPAQSTVVVH